MTERKEGPQTDASGEHPKPSITERIIAEAVPGKAKTQMLSRVTVRDLANRSKIGAILTKLRDEERGGLVTYRGVPSFLLLPVDDSNSAVERIVLEENPHMFDDAMREADEELREGKLFTPPSSGSQPNRK